ncbi:MAG: MaoC/PaaZ C-terminal domain-containing protein [Acidimicrobiales bacterium]
MRGDRVDLFWEDLEVGQLVESPARTIGEADVLAFAGLSGDYNQLHMDAEFAASSTGFGRRVAHGLLGLSVSSGLFTRTWLGAGIQRHMVAMLGLEWRFLVPLFIGDTIHVEVEVEHLREVSDSRRGLVVLRRRLFNQDGAAIQEGTTTMLIARQPDSGAPSDEGDVQAV